MLSLKQLSETRSITCNRMFAKRISFIGSKVIRSIERSLQKTLSTETIERKIAVGHADINYVQTGTGQHTLLCMPGALGSAWTDFKPQIEHLPSLLPDYTIIAWDPPGYGKSLPPNRKFGLNFFNNDAEYAYQLMIELGRPKFSVLGWSDGGITGMVLAGTYRNAVEKLVIWGANAYLCEKDIELFEAIRDVKKWSPRMREPMEKLYGVDGFPKLWCDWIDAMINIYKKRDGNICKDGAQNIFCPTLIVHGKKDPMIAYEHVPYLRKSIPNSTYHEFADGKHNIHLRYADEFNKIVADFLKS